MGLARRDGAWMGQVYINVKSQPFGAKGDNNTDDTTAIQAAITYASGLTYGGVVYFPPGIYRISATLTSSSSSVAFAGAGPLVSIIRSTSTTLDGLSLSGTVNNVVIRDLAFDATVANSGIALKLNGSTSSGIKVTNVNTVVSAG